MYLAKVVGQVVATTKQDTPEGQFLQWIQPVAAAGTPKGSPVVAVDPIGRAEKTPVQAVIVGVVDRADIAA